MVLTMFVKLLVIIFHFDLVVEARLMKVVAQEGTTVTLQPQTPELLSNNWIMWMFTPAKNLFKIQIVHSQVFKEEVHTEYKGIFQDSLLLDRKTGSLTIRNISISQSGLYHLQITKGTDVTEWNFNCAVYAPVSVPDISKGTFQPKSSSHSGPEPLPSSICQVLCSVRHGRDVSLHWFKDNELLSSTSTPDVNNTLSLRLDLDDQDNAAYSCVSENPVSNCTSSLDITAVCSSGQLPDSLLPRSYVYTLLAVSMLMIASAIATVICWKRKRTHNACTDQELLTEVLFVDVLQSNRREITDTYLNWQPMKNHQ